jgi:UrcA family protein
MNIAVAKLPTAFVFLLALAVGATSTGYAQNPAERVMIFKTAVSYADLNLDTLGGAQALYRRLKDASGGVCRQLQSLIVAPDHSKCVEASLGHAVHDVNRASLTRVYIGLHSAAIAAKYGIEESYHYATK